MRKGKKNNHPATQRGLIRLITGEFRGKRLPVLVAEGLRPTTDRTKETLFNWLMGELPGMRCLDCFAGSGSLGFEALSRGAAHVTFIELRRAVAQQLNDNVNTLQVAQRATVINQDIQHAITQLSGRFDLLFLDPPFNADLLLPTLQRLQDKGVVDHESYLYLEFEAGLALPSYLRAEREKSTNAYTYGLYRLVKT